MENIKKIIEQKIAEGESETLEFKTFYPRNRGLSKIINSMINTSGGEIYLGVHENGTFHNVDIPNSHYQKKKDNEIVIRPINSKTGEFPQHVKIYEYTIDDKKIYKIKVNKRLSLFPLKSKDGNVYKRFNDTTVQKTDKLNLYKNIETTSIIRNSRVPSLMHPGDEKVQYEALTLGPHKNDLQIKFMFDTNGIKVFGPFQEKENEISLKKDLDESKWHLKFCASKDINVVCEKQLYIVVEEIIKKRLPYILTRILFWVLLITSFIPLVRSFFKEPTFISIEILQLVSVPLPLVTIISFVLLSNKIKKILERLALVKIESLCEYKEKHIGDTISIEPNRAN